MSRTATDWAFAQKIPGTAKLVLLHLANRHNGGTGRCDPSLNRLAVDCGVGKDAVIRAIATLVEVGLIEQIKRKKDGVYVSTSYKLQTGVVAKRDKNQEEEPGREPGKKARSPKSATTKKSLSQSNEAPRASETDTLTSAALPEWIPVEAWSEFVAMRTEIKHPLKNASRRAALRELGKLRDQGHDPALVLQKSTMNSWRGLFGGDDTKAKPQPVQWREITPEEAAALWQKDFGAHV